MATCCCCQYYGSLIEAQCDVHCSVHFHYSHYFYFEGKRQILIFLLSYDYQPLYLMVVFIKKNNILYQFNFYHHNHLKRYKVYTLHVSILYSSVIIGIFLSKIYEQQVSGIVTSCSVPGASHGLTSSLCVC